MGIKEKQAWRTIVAVLQETGYDKLYDEEVHIVAECLRRCEQQCKKQKEVIDKIEKIYDVGDVVLYNRKKCKITHANWRINEYRIIEIEKPNNYHFVVGEELKEVSK